MSTGAERRPVRVGAVVGPVQPIAPMFFSRGSSLKPSRSVKANPTTDWRRACRCSCASIVGVGAVPQQALDHRRDLGGGAGLELGVDAHAASARRASRSSRRGRRSAGATRSSGSTPRTPNFFESEAHAVPVPHQLGSRAGEGGVDQPAIARRRLSRVTKGGARAAARPRSRRARRWPRSRLMPMFVPSANRHQQQPPAQRRPRSMHLAGGDRGELGGEAR